MCRETFAQENGSIFVDSSVKTACNWRGLYYHRQRNIQEDLAEFIWYPQWGKWHKDWLPKVNLYLSGTQSLSVELWRHRVRLWLQLTLWAWALYFSWNSFWSVRLEIEDLLTLAESIFSRLDVLPFYLKDQTRIWALTALSFKDLNILYKLGSFSSSL
jgi:hypothetical protein